MKGVRAPFHGPRFAVTAALAVLLPVLASCAAARSGPREPVELNGSYLIEGAVGGRLIKGTLSFPDAGGYLFATNTAVCDHTRPQAVWEFERTLRTANELSLRCGGFGIEIEFVGGDLAETGVATRTERDSYERASSCARYDENGRCVVHNTTSGSRSREYQGIVTVTRAGGV